MLTPDLLQWTLGATVGINRWSSERNAKTDFEHSCLGKRQSQVLEAVLSVATLCESGKAERQAAEPSGKSGRSAMIGDACQSKKAERSSTGR